MAGDNKSKNISARPDDAPTSELEALTDSMLLRESECELDANTFPFADEETANEDEAALRARLKRERERVEQLLFDNEQLQSRLTGAEKEIAARAELGTILQRDLKEAHKSLAARDRDLRRSRHDLQALEAQIAQAPSRATSTDTDQENSASLEDDVPVLSDTIIDTALPATPTEAPQQANQVESLQVELQDLKSYIDGRRGAWDKLEADLAARESELTSTRAQLEDALRERESLGGELASTAAMRDELRTELKSLRQELREAVRARRELASELANYEQGEVRARDLKIAEQAGQLATARQDVAVLSQRIRQAEQHADELRRMVDEQRDQLQPFRSRNEALQSACDKERVRALGLEERLEAVNRELELLHQSNLAQKSEFEREVRQLRFELSSAQDTIVGHQSINEQLTSDLIDNKTYRQALEEQLSAVEESHGDRMKKLERRVRSLEQELEDRDRKIANKDGAISALLAELSGRSRTSQSLGELEIAIGEMDDQIASAESDRTPGERDRTTRLLIGNVDGQELRFPLFKNRLTVGRTAQNDIQLGAQFISRRHAVILTDERGTRIVNWGSKNGVYVNGFRISEQALRNGDKVRIGAAEFLFEERHKR